VVARRFPAQLAPSQVFLALSISFRDACPSLRGAGKDGKEKTERKCRRKMWNEKPLVDAACKRGYALSRRPKARLKISLESDCGEFSGHFQALFKPFRAVAGVFHARNATEVIASGIVATSRPFLSI
jgi:hypothetical protein